jgi:hypothetical protein
MLIRVRSQKRQGFARREHSLINVGQGSFGRSSMNHTSKIERNARVEHSAVTAQGNVLNTARVLGHVHSYEPALASCCTRRMKHKGLSCDIGTAQATATKFCLPHNANFHFYF